MDQNRLRGLLERVQAGETGIADALTHLRGLPFSDLGFAKVDHHRALRQGAPEVIFGSPKTADQIAEIALEILKRDQNVLITRLDAEKGASISARIPDLLMAPAARTASVVRVEIPQRIGTIAVVTAGTGDQPVAEEAVETLRMLGIDALRIYDVGVAGVHRLLAHTIRLQGVTGIIVVAGMEGALPSVVGGLVACPVVAVPTSVGYGAHWGGLTPLMGMLASCASGLVVVNIDNGFGAAMAMGRIVPQAAPKEG